MRSPHGATTRPTSRAEPASGRRRDTRSSADGGSRCRSYYGTVTTLTLIGKPDCHLCDVAREVVETVVAERPEDSVIVEERSILEDPALYEVWWEKIPVVLIDGTLHGHWRVSPDRLRAALDDVTG